MKYIFLLAIILAVKISSAQTNAPAPSSTDSLVAERLNAAGEKLKAYTKSHNTGIAVMLAGSIISIVGAANGVLPTIYVGGTISLIGFLIAEVGAPSFIKEAGVILKGGKIDNPKPKYDSYW